MTGTLPGKSHGLYSIDDKNKKKIGFYSSKKEKTRGKANYYKGRPGVDRPPTPPCCATCATCAFCVGAGSIVEEDIEL